MLQRAQTCPINRRHFVGGSDARIIRGGSIDRKYQPGLDLRFGWPSCRLEADDLATGRV